MPIKRTVAPLMTSLLTSSMMRPARLPVEGIRSMLTVVISPELTLTSACRKVSNPTADTSTVLPSREVETLSKV